MNVLLMLGTCIGTSSCRWLLLHVVDVAKPNRRLAAMNFFMMAQPTNISLIHRSSARQRMYVQDSRLLQISQSRRHITCYRLYVPQRVDVDVDVNVDVDVVVCTYTGRLPVGPWKCCIV